MATKLIISLAVLIESLLPTDPSSSCSDFTHAGEENTKSKKESDNEDGPMQRTFITAAPIANVSSGETSANKNDHTDDNFESGVSMNSSCNSVDEANLASNGCGGAGGEGGGEAGKDDEDSSESTTLLGSSSMVHSIKAAFPSTPSSKNAIKFVNIILFSPNFVERLLPEPFPSMASSPHITMGVVVVMYLVFLILYYPLYLTDLLIIPGCSVVMVLIGLNYVARKVGSAMAYMGSSIQYQQDVSNDYLRRAILAKLGNISGTLAQFTTSVILALNGKIHRTEVGKIFQFSSNLVVYADILSDYGRHVNFARDDLFRSGSLSVGDNEVFKQLSSSLTSLAGAVFEFEPLVRMHFESSAAPAGSSSKTSTNSSAVTNRKMLVNHAGRVMQLVGLLESMLKDMVPTKTNDDGGSLQLVLKAWSFLTSDCSASGLCGGSNTIAKTWRYEKLSFPIIRSILFNKYRCVRVNIKGCSDNKIDGIIVPYKFDLATVRPMSEDEDTTSSSLSSSSSTSTATTAAATPPATKKRSNSTTSNGINNKFSPSPNGMVLFCCPNAGFYENLEDMISSGYESCWFHYYNQKLGYDYCTYNYRGYNLSEGSPRFPEEIKQDALMLARHLVEKHRVTKLIIHGESIGGLVATYIANELAANDAFSRVDVRVTVGLPESTEMASGVKSTDARVVHASSQLQAQAPLVHALVCDRTFTSLDSVASRLILNKNILGRCLRYIARWDTSTISNYLECKTARKVIMQDPIDEIISFPASLQVGVSARLKLISSSVFSSSSSAATAVTAAESSVLSNSTTISKIIQNNINSSQLVCDRFNWLGIFCGLASYDYFQSIKFLSSQYNINHFGGFDVPYRDEEECMIRSLKNNLTNDLKLTNKFIDHFTACLRHLFVCSRYEAAVARATGLSTVSSSSRLGNSDDNANPTGGLPKYDLACHFAHPSADWVRAFCGINVSCDTPLSSSSSNSNISSSFDPNSSSGIGIFTKAWVAVARIHGGTGQLLGNSLKTAPIVFDEAVRTSGDRDVSDSSSRGDGHSRSSSRGTAASDDSSGSDIGSDDYSVVEDMSDVELGVSTSDITGGAGGGGDAYPVGGKIKSSSTSQEDVHPAKSKKMFFNGREKDSVAAWLLSVLTFGSSVRSSGSSRIDRASLLDRQMPAESRVIEEGIGDIDALTGVLKSFYDISDASTSVLDATTHGSESSMSEYKRKLMQQYKKTIAVARQRRRSLQMGIVNVSNSNIKAGYWSPVVETCLDSLKFIRNSLAVIRDHHQEVDNGGGNNTSISAISSDNNNKSVNHSSYGKDNNSSNSSDSVISSAPVWASLPPPPSAHIGRLLSIHAGHNGWVSPENLSDLTAILAPEKFV